MEVLKLSDDVFDQIKDFNYRKLTEEQKLLIDKLISNEELKYHYKMNGLCKECKQPKAAYFWCQICTFQQNFKNWTSGNHDIDEFIRRAQLKAKNPREVLEWIEYDKFENVEYLAEGGFGTTYKAIWKDGYIAKWNSINKEWMRRGDELVVLKCLHNSQDITVEFLREIESHITLSNSDDIVQCYGITKDPITKNFMMIMGYANHGSLRQHLNNNFNSFNWNVKLRNLYHIAFGLEIIHRNGLIHHDFHCGNILIHKFDDKTFSFFITDLGLCKPANIKPSQNGNRKIYGVLPYIAPEVLRGKEYTQASDIYGFGIVAYEVCTGLPPYNNIAHDEFLTARICQGLRPTSSYKIPQLILDLIKQCWDADPLKRPKAEELQNLLWDLYIKAENKEALSLFSEQIKESDEINEVPSFLTAVSSSTGTHAQAIYTSRLLVEYSESTKIDFTKLNIEDSKESLNTSETIKFDPVSQFEDTSFNRQKRKRSIEGTSVSTTINNSYNRNSKTHIKAIDVPLHTNSVFDNFFTLYNNLYLPLFLLVVGLFIHLSYIFYEF